MRRPKGTPAERKGRNTLVGFCGNRRPRGRDQPAVCFAVPDETSPQLTRLVLALPDWRSFQSTDSADGIMPRPVPVHIMAGLFKSVAIGSPVKETLGMDAKRPRAGNPKEQEDGIRLRIGSIDKIYSGSYTPRRNEPWCPGKRQTYRIRMDQLPQLRVWHSEWGGALGRRREEPTEWRRSGPSHNTKAHNLNGRWRCHHRMT